MQGEGNVKKRGIWMIREANRKKMLDLIYKLLSVVSDYHIDDNERNSIIRASTNQLIYYLDSDEAGRDG